MENSKRPPEENRAETTVDISEIMSNKAFIRCVDVIGQMIVKYAGEIDIDNIEINK